MPSKVTLVFAATLALTTSSIVEAGRPRMYNPQRAERGVDFAIDADLDVDNNQKTRRGFSSFIPSGLEPGKSGDDGNVFDLDTRQKSLTAAVIVNQTVVVPSAGTSLANLTPEPSPESQLTTLSSGDVRPEPGTIDSVFPDVSTPEPTATSQNTANTSQKMAPATTGRNILDPISSNIGDLLLPAPSSANSTMVESETSTPLSSSPSTFEMATRSLADVISSSATNLSPVTVSLPVITLSLVTTSSPVTASSPAITSSFTTISSPSTVSLPAITLSLVTTLLPVTASSPATILSPTTVSLPTIKLSPVATLSPITASSSTIPSSPAASDFLPPVTSVVLEKSTKVTSRKTFKTSTRMTETPSGTSLIPILTSVVSSVLPVPTSESAVLISSVTKTSTGGTQITTSPTRILPTAETSSIATPAFSSPTFTSSVPTPVPTDSLHNEASTTTSGEATNLTPANSANDTATAAATSTNPTSRLLSTSTDTGVVGLSLSSDATKPATTSVGSISTPVESTPAETAAVATRTETTPLRTPTPISTQTGILGITTTATGTGTSTGDWLPTTMILDSISLSITVPTTTKTTTTITSLPANIPKVIVPFDDDKPAPKDSTLVQIGFKFPLNYGFVSSHSVAAAQIFHLLPKALIDAGSLDTEKVRIAKLVPLDTRNTDGYITTLAKLHYPHKLVDNLRASIWAPNSKLYNNPLELINNLTALINPTINIIGNNDEEGAKTSGSSPNNNDAFGPGSDQSSQSSKQRATTAGIVVGAVGIGAVYGAAMFIVARRYKRRCRNRRRSSSLSSVDRSDALQYADKGSIAFLDDDLLRPKRGGHGGWGQNSISSTLSANISAPVATKNSLGWN